METISHTRSKNAYFFATGLYDEDRDKGYGWKMMTLSSIYERFKSHHGDVVIDYLKIDIEGAEWKVNSFDIYVCCCFLVQRKDLLIDEKMARVR